MKDLDPLHQCALEFLRNYDGHPCIAAIQREFRIGYSRACSIMEKMIERGEIFRTYSEHNDVNYHIWPRIVRSE